MGEIVEMYTVIYWEKGEVFPAVNPNGSLILFKTVEGADELAQQIDDEDKGKEARTISIEGVNE